MIPTAIDVPSWVSTTAVIDLPILAGIDPEFV
jgi:hypothetical protein